MNETSAPAGLGEATPDEMRRLLDALYRVEGLLSGVSNLDLLLQTIIDESQRLADAEASSILLFDDAAGELYFHVATSEAGDPEALKKSVRLKLGEGIAGTAAAARVSINMPDAAIDPRVHRAADALTHFKTRSVLATPMLDGDRLVGVVEVLNKRGSGGFTDLDQRVLEMFSALAAVAITRARLIEENLRAAQLAAVGQAVAGISHHTKNILTALDASVELVDAGLTNKNEKLVSEGWPILKRSVGRLSHVVEDMLAFSKPRQPRLGSCDVAALVRETLEAFHALLTKRDIEVAVDTSGLRGPAQMDARGLHQALLNLLTNAADAAPAAGGRIRVEARHDSSGNLELSVCDNGPGVPEAERSKIFHPLLLDEGIQRHGARSRRDGENHARARWNGQRRRRPPRWRVFCVACPGAATGDLSAMAKKAAKQKAAPAKTSGPREFVGWGFWLLCFAVLSGPCWFAAYRMTIESERNGIAPWITAFALSALGAGLLSFTVNYALRARAAAASTKQKHAARKKSKREHS